MEEEGSDPIGPINQEMVKAILARRYWNYEKICAWIETLPQIQELRKDKDKKDPTSKINHFPDDD